MASTITTDPTTSTPTLLDKSGETIGELDFSAFGAVSVVEIRGTAPARVEISPARRAAFAQLVTKFSVDKNNYKQSINLPSEADAAQLTAELKTYADEKGTTRVDGKDVPNLTVTFPHFIDAHTIEAHEDKDGNMVPPKYVPANKYPSTWNTGVNVTFRFVARRAANKNGPVTVTTVADAENAAELAANAAK